MKLNSKKNLLLGCQVSIFHLLLLLLGSFALTPDGVLLLSFKYSILNDPLSVLENWRYGDETPCSWNGVKCTEIETMFRVTSLVLPDSQLLGSIPEDIGMIQHLQVLDFSNNFLNGTLPNSIFNASQLQVLSLANNVISGEISESIGEMKSLQVLNLSDNAFVGSVPKSLITLKNLTFVSLRSNYFSGKIPSGFDSVETLDLSSNLLNGSLPEDFGGDSLKYLNLSYNKISGSIPPSFAQKIPINSTIDLSFNNLTGPIPQSQALITQKTESLSGNFNLCGKPMRILCSIPSTQSNPPNITSSPAIAAMPRTIDTNPETNTNSNNQPNGLRPTTIAGIIVGDLAGIGIVGIIVLLVYQQRKNKTTTNSDLEIKQNPKPRNPTIPCFWSAIKESPTTSETTGSGSDSDEQEEKTRIEMRKEGNLVTVDNGETNLELETLLRASASVVGTKGGTIVYKAVVDDGRTFAVRRIGVGECGVERMKDFENQVRSIAKIRHPNLVRVRGFCWGELEKLVICDYVPNGNLAAISHRRGSSSSSSLMNLTLEMRVKIARGIARGLAFLHDKKHIHGNLKPTNILLSSNMEPIIADFGLRRLLSAGGAVYHHNLTPNNSFRHQQQDGLGLPPPTTGPSAGSGNQSPYQAPEWYQVMKPTAKCDVYSYGVVLLEVLSGRAACDMELKGDDVDVAGERNRVMRMMADVAMRWEMEQREEVVLRCFRLGFRCVCLVPHKRPSMREALQILDNIPC